MEIATKKNLRAVTKTTVTTWAESHCGCQSLSCTICQPKSARYKTWHLACLQFFCLRSSTLRRAGDHADLAAACCCVLFFFAPGVYAPCVCVPVSVGLCVMWLSSHLKLSQSHSPESPGPPTLAAPIPERWSPSCASGAARCSGLSRH